MTGQQQEKLERLKEILHRTDGCAVAFSGGVDSTLLLTVASEVLDDRCLAIIAVSPIYPKHETDRAQDCVEKQQIPHEVLRSGVLDSELFRRNPTDRCYWCKREIFGRAIECAREHGLRYLADGTNADDAADYRPGTRAAEELGVISPLRTAGLTKDDVRAISRDAYDLPTWNEPAMACLASRFPYGDAITETRIQQVAAVEEALRQAGCRIYRARRHGKILRLELGEEEMARLMEPEMREEVVQTARAQGFEYVTLDLEPYRTGRMNEEIENQ